MRRYEGKTASGGGVSVSVAPVWLTLIGKCIVVRRQQSKEKNILNYWSAIHICRLGH